MLSEENANKLYKRILIHCIEKENAILMGQHK